MDASHVVVSVVSSYNNTRNNHKQTLHSAVNTTFMFKNQNKWPINSVMSSFYCYTDFGTQSRQSRKPRKL